MQSLEDGEIEVIFVIAGISPQSGVLDAGPEGHAVAGKIVVVSIVKACAQRSRTGDKIVVSIKVVVGEIGIDIRNLSGIVLIHPRKMPVAGDLFAQRHRTAEALFGVVVALVFAVVDIKSRTIITIPNTGIGDVEVKVGAVARKIGAQPHGDSASKDVAVVNGGVEDDAVVTAVSAAHHDVAGLCLFDVDHQIHLMVVDPPLVDDDVFKKAGAHQCRLGIFQIRQIERITGSQENFTPNHPIEGAGIAGDDHVADIDLLSRIDPVDYRRGMMLHIFFKIGHHPHVGVSHIGDLGLDAFHIAAKLFDVEGFAGFETQFIFQNHRIDDLFTQLDLDRFDLVDRAFVDFEIQNRFIVVKIDP